MTTGRGLTGPEWESLERGGYLVVQSLLDETVLGRLRSGLEKLVRQTVACARTWGITSLSTVLVLPRAAATMARAADRSRTADYAGPIPAAGCCSRT